MICVKVQIDTNTRHRHILAWGILDICTPDIEQMKRRRCTCNNASVVLSESNVIVAEVGGLLTISRSVLWSLSHTTQVFWQSFQWM